MFGVTEPQILTYNDGKSLNTPLPAIVCVVGDIEPPSTLGITSVQLGKEEIVPMKEMKIEWKDFKFEKESSKNVKILYCNLRHSKLKKKWKKKIL